MHLFPGLVTFENNEESSISCWKWLHHWFVWEHDAGSLAEQKTQVQGEFNEQKFFSSPEAPQSRQQWNCLLHFQGTWTWSAHISHYRVCNYWIKTKCAEWQRRSGRHSPPPTAPLQLFSSTNLKLNVQGSGHLSINRIRKGFLKCQSDKNIKEF